MVYQAKRNEEEQQQEQPIIGGGQPTTSFSSGPQPQTQGQSPTQPVQGTSYGAFTGLSQDTSGANQFFAPIQQSQQQAQSWLSTALDPFTSYNPMQFDQDTFFSGLTSGDLTNPQSQLTYQYGGPTQLDTTQIAPAYQNLNYSTGQMQTMSGLQNLIGATTPASTGMGRVLDAYLLSNDPGFQTQARQARQDYFDALGGLRQTEQTSRDLVEQNTQAAADTRQQAYDFARETGQTWSDQVWSDNPLENFETYASAMGLNPEQVTQGYNEYFDQYMLPHTQFDQYAQAELGLTPWDVEALYRTSVGSTPWDEWRDVRYQGTENGTPTMSQRIPGYELGSAQEAQLFDQWFDQQFQGNRMPEDFDQWLSQIGGVQTEQGIFQNQAMADLYNDYMENFVNRETPDPTGWADFYGTQTANMRTDMNPQIELEWLNNLTTLLNDPTYAALAATPAQVTAQDLFAGIADPARTLNSADPWNYLTEAPMIENLARGSVDLPTEQAQQLWQQELARREAARLAELERQRLAQLAAQQQYYNDGGGGFDNYGGTSGTSTGSTGGGYVGGGHEAGYSAGPSGSW